MNQPDMNTLQIWANQNLERGCSVASLIDAMRNSGHQDSIIRKIIQSLSLTSHPRLPEVTSGTNLELPDREVSIVISVQDPKIFLVRDFLSNDECLSLINLATSHLRRSLTVSYQSGESELHPDRNSQGAFFQRGETPLIEKIEKRISALIGWPVENGEGLQVLRYGLGGQYRPHHDYFDPSFPGSRKHLEQGGQRVGTLLMYLNTPTQGGHTHFPKIGLSVAPISGHALYFSSSYAGVLDVLSEHGSAPVMAGEKWVATKWLRERPYN